MSRASLLMESDRHSLILWLLASGFERVRKNEAWHTLVGVLGGATEVEVTLPAVGNDSSVGDRSGVRTIELIADHESEDFEDARFRITGYNRDLHKFRVGESNFIPLGEATKHPKYIRHLIGYAHAAERRQALPYYGGGTLRSKKLDDYEFGHTIRGSFIMTVRSPRLGKAKPVSKQHELNFDGVEIDTEDVPEVIPPIARRVSTRIVRSLSIVSDSYYKTDKSDLQSSYVDALNANMAEAIAGLLQEADEPVQFKTIWSPSLGYVEADGDSDTVLSPSYASTLRDAAKVLRSKESRKEQILIVVTGFVSDAPPMKISSSKKVYGKWIRDGKKTRSVYLDVSNPDNYKLAQEAHNEWRGVYVVGELHENRGRYYMNNIEHFGYDRAQLPLRNS